MFPWLIWSLLPSRLKSTGTSKTTVNLRTTSFASGSGCRLTTMLSSRTSVCSLAWASNMSRPSSTTWTAKLIFITGTARSVLFVERAVTYSESAWAWSSWPERPESAVSVPSLAKSRVSHTSVNRLRTCPRPNSLHILSPGGDIPMAMVASVLGTTDLSLIIDFLQLIKLSIQIISSFHTILL